MPTNDDTFRETLTYTNGETLVTLGQLFEVDPDNICRWAIVLTAHVPTEPLGTHDIRVASNCEDEDIPSLLRIGIKTMESE